MEGVFRFFIGEMNKMKLPEALGTLKQKSHTAKVIAINSQTIHQV